MPRIHYADWPIHCFIMPHKLCRQFAEVVQLSKQVQAVGLCFVLFPQTANGSPATPHTSVQSARADSTYPALLCGNLTVPVLQRQESLKRIESSVWDDGFPKVDVEKMTPLNGLAGNRGKVETAPWLLVLRTPSWINGDCPTSLDGDRVLGLLHEHQAAGN